mgnify:CR=1 FL=1
MPTTVKFVVVYIHIENTLHGIDAYMNNKKNATFAEFTLFGQGNIITGKETDYLFEETRGRNEDTPHEISDLLVKKYIFTVTPSSKIFNNDYCHFQGPGYRTCG